MLCKWNIGGDYRLFTKQKAEAGAPPYLDILRLEYIVSFLQIAICCIEGMMGSWCHIGLCPTRWIVG